MEGSSSEPTMVAPSYSSRALALISSSNLPHPEKCIVQAFVEEAVDPELAAHYLLQLTGFLSDPVNGRSRDLELVFFLTEWTKLLNRCKYCLLDIISWFSLLIKLTPGSSADCV